MLAFSGWLRWRWWSRIDGGHYKPAESNLDNIKPKGAGMVHGDARLNSQPFRYPEPDSRYKLDKSYRSPRYAHCHICGKLE